jgi:hypothetical protein
MTGNLYHWRACEKLTLVQAALLVVDADPQEWDCEKLFDNPPIGFAAIYQALLHAINEKNTCIGYKLEIIENRARCTRDSEWRDGFSVHVLSKDVKRWLMEIGIKSNFFCSEEQSIAAYSPRTQEQRVEVRTPNTVEDKPLWISERDSLLKLVIGMAVQGYSYNPEAKKSGTVAEIKFDIEQLGLSLDDETIRSYLKQASAKLPGKPINT